MATMATVKEYYVLDVPNEPNTTLLRDTALYTDSMRRQIDLVGVKKIRIETAAELHPSKKMTVKG